MPDELTRALEGSFPDLPAEEREPALRALARMLAQGRAAWPDLELDASVFVAFVGERVKATSEVAAALDATKSDDLYIVCACLAGDDRALRAFEEHFGRDIDGTLSRLRMPVPARDEVRQRLRVQLFVTRPQSAPMLTTYSGRGSLAKWLRVSTTREALRYLSSNKRELLVDDHAFDWMALPDEDGELGRLKRQYREDFRLAFEEAFGRLSARQVSLVRYRYVDDCSASLVAEIFGIHVATVRKQLATIRGLLLKWTREALMRRLAIDRSQFESIMRLIESRLEVTLRRLVVPEDD